MQRSRAIDYFFAFTVGTQLVDAERDEPAREQIVIELFVLSPFLEAYWVERLRMLIEGIMLSMLVPRDSSTFSLSGPLRVGRSKEREEV